MQSCAWYVIAPDGKRYGPSYTEKQAQIAAVKIALKGRAVEEEIAFLLYRSMAQVGWQIVKSPMKDLKP